MLVSRNTVATLKTSVVKDKRICHSSPWSSNFLRHLINFTDLSQLLEISAYKGKWITFCWGAIHMISSESCKACHRKRTRTCQTWAKIQMTVGMEMWAATLVGRTTSRCSGPRSWSSPPSPSSPSSSTASSSSPSSPWTKRLSQEYAWDLRPRKSCTSGIQLNFVNFALFS